MTVHSDFLRLDIDPDELAAAVARALGRRYRLAPLSVKCTYPVFRGEADGASAVFVKVGTEDEWRRTANLLRDVGACGLFARFQTEESIVFQGHAVFVTEWKDTAVVRPEEMNERQQANFVDGCVRMSAALQRAKDFTPVQGSAIDPERLYDVLTRYVRRHPLAGRLLADLLAIPVAQRTFGTRPLSVIHGDFHSKNFGFVGDELSSVFDFDQLTQGLACGDLANALVERFSCLGLPAAARRRLREVTRRIVAQAPWPREDFVVTCNILRLRFAARRIEKHPGSAWVALDVLRRDRRIREFLSCLVPAGADAQHSAGPKMV